MGADRITYCSEEHGLWATLRCRLRYYVDERWEERKLVRWICSIMIAVHWGLGLSIILGGQARFSVPTYQPLIDMAPWGRVEVWGITIILSGLLIMQPYKWPSVLGYWLGMMWMIMWASLFAVSLMRYSASAATPVVAYAGFAMINTALLTARVLERPERD